MTFSEKRLICLDLASRLSISHTTQIQACSEVYSFVQEFLGVSRPSRGKLDALISIVPELNQQDIDRVRRGGLIYTGSAPQGAEKIGELTNANIFKKLALVNCIADVSFSGTGKVTEYFIKKLSELDFKLSITPSARDYDPPQHIEKLIKCYKKGERCQNYDIHVDTPSFIITTLDRLAKARGRSLKDSVAFVTWETSKLPTIYVETLNKLKKVIVPCSWLRDSFIKSGVRTPISIVREGINEEIFQVRNLPDVCTFGVAGRIAHGLTRKGIVEAISCFQEAFAPSDKVMLKVKGYSDCKHTVPYDPRITVDFSSTPGDPSFSSEADIAEWLSSISVFFSLCRGEGWGLFQHEAMASGRPLISVCAGGVSEFFSPELGFALDYTEQKADGGYANLDAGNWFVPNRESAIRQLRYARDHYEEVREKGLKSAEVARKLTWKAAATALADELECLE